MTKEEFYNIYNDVHIKCYTNEQLSHLINSYANNKTSWKTKLSFGRFIEENAYNDVGVIIKFIGYSAEEMYCYWGYYDEKVHYFIEYDDIFSNTNKEKNNMNEITRILNKIYKNEDLRETIVPLFMSNPGIGKTELINEFAKFQGVKIIEMIASQMSPFEVSGICIPSHTKERMVYYDFDSLLELKDGDILFLDELPNANPSVLNAMLTLIGSRKMISGKKLPKIMIVAAGNTQGMTPMTPQIKERFIWYNILFDEKSFINYMINKYDITLNIGKKLANLVKSEEFIGDNFYTPRSIDKAVNMLIKDVETPYKTVILPILEELITNNTEDTIMINNKEFLKGESLTWLKIKQYKDEIITE